MFITGQMSKQGLSSGTYQLLKVLCSRVWHCVSCLTSLIPVLGGGEEEGKGEGEEEGDREEEEEKEEKLEFKVIFILYSKSKTILGYIRPCLKNQESVLSIEEKK